MNALLIFAFVHAMPNPAMEELSVMTKPMTAQACHAHVEKMTARYNKGGRWAESFRHFHMRCEAIK